ncbi:MAG: DUF421 domain-containing protein [Oscillospiraceae bacterium]|nr:DUF421 domain-containing protein [Oscillospiraceae bacterium]
MLNLILRATILYLLAMSAVRFMGKKQISELQPSELVTTIIISGIVTMALEESNLSIIAGIVPIMLIVCLDVIITGLNLKSHKFRRLTTGMPDVIISNGNIDQLKLRNLRYTIDDVMESMREASIFDITEVQHAIVENTGKISFYKKSDAEIKAGEGNACDAPAPLIKDGHLVKANLKLIDKDHDWVRGILNQKRLSVKDVFLMTADCNGGYNLVEKQR